MRNEVAMRHLLGRGSKIELPLTLLIPNVPSGSAIASSRSRPSIVL
jgi:hypothetical protein